MFKGLEAVLTGILAGFSLRYGLVRGLVDGSRHKVAHSAPLQRSGDFDQRVRLGAGAHLESDGGRSWRGFGGGHGIDRIDKDYSAVCFLKIQHICYI